MALDLNLVSALLFYLIIFLLIYFNRKKFDIQAKVIALYRMKFGINAISWIASLCPRFWRFLATIGIYIGFAGILFIFGYLIYSLYDMIVNPLAPAAIALVIPGVQIPGSPVFVPFWYGIIALFIVVLVHETAHGIAARAQNIKLNSTGVGMFAIFPIAFVEPDEKQMKKRPVKQQLRIFAAGPFANILLAIAVFFLAFYAVLPMAMSNVDVAGIEVQGFEKGYPAEISGLQIGDIITKINNVSITETSNFTYEMDKISLGDTVSLSTANATYSVKTQPSPANATEPYIGVFVSDVLDIKPELKEKYGNFLPWIWFYLFKLLQWIVVLSAGIGLANLLPLGPVDGGRMMLSSLSAVFKKEGRAIAIWKQISYICLLLLILNFIYPYLRMLG